MCFLAAIWLSGVLLYAYENQITTSASKCDSPFRFTIKIPCSSAVLKIYPPCIKTSFIQYNFLDLLRFFGIKKGAKINPLNFY